jgi:transcriptional regulator with XRE-family HTH domain
MQREGIERDWEAVLGEADTAPLRALAARLGVRPGEVAAALSARRAPDPRPATTPRPAESAHRPEPDTIPATDERARPGSKDASLLDHWDLLGQVPDADVARRAGVSVRTVASFRARHQIPGYKGPRRASKAAVRRTSKVDSFAHLLGKQPDRVVAVRAGVSLNAVRNYRTKHGISAAPRDRASEPAPPAADSLQAFEVVLQREGGPEVRVVVAADITTAVQAAGREGARVVSVRHLAPVLG